MEFNANEDTGEPHRRLWAKTSALNRMPHRNVVLNKNLFQHRAAHKVQQADHPGFQAVPGSWPTLLLPSLSRPRRCPGLEVRAIPLTAGVPSLSDEGARRADSCSWSARTEPKRKYTILWISHVSVIPAIIETIRPSNKPIPRPDLCAIGTAVLNAKNSIPRKRISPTSPIWVATPKTML